MKRRELLIGTGGLLASMVPQVVRATPCPPPSVGLEGGESATSTCSPGASADWNTRISGPGVVWHHNFDSAAEVNQFRWTNGYSGGNDPLAKGSNGSNVSWQASGGADGGPFMRLTYPGGGAGGGGSYWARPFAALNSASTGRGAADPAAAGSIAVQPYVVSDGSSTLVNWGNTSTNAAWYGAPSTAAANPTKFQGTDFYIQVRVRRVQTPGTPPDSGSYSYITGKSVWLTTMNASYTAQELVTFGQSAFNSDQVGVQSWHNTYVGANFDSVGGNQPNSTITTANNGNKWRYSGGWDTLLYHITPGTAGGTGANRTRFEVWAQHDLTLHPGEAGLYIKIWDVMFTSSYDSGTTSTGAPSYPGWNALLLAIYHNGSPFQTSFSYDYDQVIFSRATIAAPQA